MFEPVEPTCLWLAVPVFSVIDFEGICVRLVFAVIPYFLFLIKLSKNSKRVFCMPNYCRSCRDSRHCKCALKKAIMSRLIGQRAKAGKK